jgi:S-adenosylmethionine uptake transporter
MWVGLLYFPYLNPSCVINKWRTHVSRGVLFAISAYAFITALAHLPLADTMCIAFAAPLIVTLLWRVIFKEQVGPYCLAAVLVGFIGVVIMIQPWGHPFAGF